MPTGRSVIRSVGVYARVGRAQIAWVTLLPLLVGLMSGEDITPAALALMLVAGAALHLFWWVVNDLADTERDTAASTVTGAGVGPRPIASGRVGRARAWGVATAAGTVAVVLAALAGGPVTGAWMALGVALQGYANWYQKHPDRRIPTTAVDVVAGIAFGTPVVVGASASGEDAGAAIVLLLAACTAMIVILNTLVGNQKDLPGDRHGGARTVALELGVTESGRDRLDYPLRYRRYVYGWQGLYTGLLVAAALSGAANGDVSRPVLGLAVAAVVVDGVLSLHSIRRLFAGARRAPTGGPLLFFGANVGAYVAAAMPLSSIPRSIGTVALLIALMAVGVALRSLEGPSPRAVLARPWQG